MRLTLSVLGVVFLHGAAAAQTAEITVITYNTKHGGRAPYSAESQMDVIARQQPRPDVVLLQEMPQAEVERYVTGLNARYGFTGRDSDGFQRAYWPGCAEAADDVCTRTQREGNATLVVPRYPIVEREGRFFFEADHWNAGRGALRVAVRAGPETIQVFNVHLQANHEGESAQPQRARSVEVLRDLCLQPSARGSEEAARHQIRPGDSSVRSGGAPVSAHQARRDERRVRGCSRSRRRSWRLVGPDLLRILGSRHSAHPGIGRAESRDVSPRDRSRFSDLGRRCFPERRAFSHDQFDFGTVIRLKFAHANESL